MVFNGNFSPPSLLELIVALPICIVSDETKSLNGFSTVPIDILFVDGIIFPANVAEPSSSILIVLSMAETISFSLCRSVRKFAVIDVKSARPIHMLLLEFPP